MGDTQYSNFKKQRDMVKAIAELTDDIYGLQLGKGGGQTIYPFEKKDKVVALLEGWHVLDTYATLSASGDGSFVAIPYSIAYGEKLREVLAIIQDNLLFRHQDLNWLETSLARALQTNDRRQVVSDWLAQYGPNNPDFPSEYIVSFGPIEAYENDFWFRVFSYVLLKLSWELQDKFSKYVEHIGDFLTMIWLNDLSVRSRLYIGDAIEMSWQLGKFQASGRSRPTSTDLVQAYGSVQQLFLNNMKLKAKSMYRPTYKLLRWEELTEDDFFEYFVLHIAMHEISHPIKLPWYVESFGEQNNHLFLTFEEIKTDLMALARVAYLEQSWLVSKGTTKNLIKVVIADNLHMSYVCDKSWWNKRLEYDKTFDYLMSRLSSRIQTLRNWLDLSWEDDTIIQEVYIMAKEAIELMRRSDIKKFIQFFAEMGNAGSKQLLLHKLSEAQVSY